MSKKPTAAETLKKEQAKFERIKWEAHLLRDVKGYKLIGFQLEYRFHAVRQWRFDIAFPAKKLGVEVDGLVWNGKGGHQTGDGYEKDRQKDDAALLMGWKVYRVTPKMIKSGQAIQTIEALLKM